MILTVRAEERHPTGLTPIGLVSVNYDRLPTNWATLDPDKLAEHRKRRDSWHSRIMWRAELS